MFPKRKIVSPRESSVFSLKKGGFMKTQSHQAGYVPVSQKLTYSIASGGGNIITTIVGSFISAYLTDSVGIAVATVSTMMLVNRLFDLFSDFLMGSLVDKTHSRLGKARPWLALSAPLIALFLILLFSVPESMGYTGKVIYVYIMYLFINAVAFTIFFISHTALLSRLTLNGMERQKIASLEQIMNQVAGLAVTTFWVPLTRSVGYRGTAIVYGVAAGILILVGFFGTKENIEEEAVSNAAPEQNVPFKQAISCLAKNKFFWLETALFCLLLLHNCSAGMVTYYFCNNVLENAGYVAILSACGMVPALLMNLILPTLVKKFGKKNMLLAGAVTVIVSSILMGLFSSNMILVAAFYACKGFMLGALFSCAFALTGDVVDYGEWKFGVRSEGLVMSGVSIGQKIGLGFGPAIAGWILAFGGYDGMAATQSASAIAAIKFAYTFLPAIIGVIILLVCLSFNIDKYSAQMQEDLTKKHMAK